MDRRDILVPHRIFAEAGRRSRLSGKASAIREAPTFGRRASLAFARMPRAEARGGMATGDRGVARRVKPGGFGAVPLGFATDAPRGSAGSFTIPLLFLECL